MARMRRRLVSLTLLLATGAAARAEDGAPIDAAALFARTCATCHGLDGSGTGPTVLDRPARNFKEGGFSFGNTPEAIARTLAHGIPGSPMPSFQGVLSEEERWALAEYVVTLGPPIKEVSEAETIMVVRDRPLIVRGILPPLAEGGPKIPRGLLVGTPDGLTFQYDLDDVRLVAVRAGEFVKRTDWGGRGGTPLEPLGRVVWSEAQLSPAGRWMVAQDPIAREPAEVVGFHADFEPAVAHLESTRLAAPSADTDRTTRVSYVIEAADARRLASVSEGVSGRAVGSASGFTRRLEVRKFEVHGSWIALDLRPLAGGGEWKRLDGAESPSVERLGAGVTSWWTRSRSDASIEVLGLRADLPGRHAGNLPLIDTRAGAVELILPELWSTVEVIRLFAPAATDDLTAALLGSDA